MGLNFKVFFFDVSNFILRGFFYFRRESEYDCYFFWVKYFLYIWFLMICYNFGEIWNVKIKEEIFGILNLLFFIDIKELCFL